VFVVRKNNPTTKGTKVHEGRQPHFAYCIYTRFRACVATGQALHSLWQTRGACTNRGNVAGCARALAVGGDGVCSRTVDWQICVASATLVAGRSMFFHFCSSLFCQASNFDFLHPGSWGIYFRGCAHNSDKRRHSRRSQPGMARRWQSCGGDRECRNRGDVATGWGGRAASADRC